jgi:hypothetical protein
MTGVTVLAVVIWSAALPATFTNAGASTTFACE